MSVFTAGPTWCAAAGVTAGGTSSHSRSSDRVWSPGGYAGAGTGRKRWQMSWSSGDICAVWPPCGTWSESASLTWLRRWAGTLCIFEREKKIDEHNQLVLLPASLRVNSYIDYTAQHHSIFTEQTPQSFSEWIKQSEQFWIIFTMWLVRRKSHWSVCLEIVFKFCKLGFTTRFYCGKQSGNWLILAAGNQTT